MERQPAVDVSKLTSDFLGDIPVTFAITTKQSKEAGGVTPGGTTVTISATLNELTVDLGGQYQIGSGSTPGFATINGNKLTLDPKAAAGSSLQIGINMSGGVRKILTVTKKTENALIFSFKE